MACRVLVRAACWAWSGAREAVLDWMEECRVCVRVREMAERRASFSGLGGIGGAGRSAGWAVGRVVSEGEVRRSVGGAGFGACLGFCGVACWVR